MSVLGLVGDVTENVPSYIARTEAALGPIDILINNAGISRLAKFTEESDMDTWWKVHEINVKAPLAFIHAVLPSFLATASKENPKVVFTIGSSGSDRMSSSQIPAI